VTDLQPDDKDASIALWTNRKIKVLYALGEQCNSSVFVLCVTFSSIFVTSVLQATV